MSVRVATSDAELAAVFAVRRAVFVEEQGVDESLEYDEHDEPGAGAVDHFLAVDGEAIDEPTAGDAVGAARLRPHPERATAGKVERVAVRGAHRGNGWGRRLMAAVHERARERGFDALRLHAQVPVTGFYGELGYGVVSDEPFEEAGIPHVAMVRALSADPPQ